MPVFLEKGGDPERVRESQRRRFADVGLVDQVIEHDKRWRNRNPLSERTQFLHFCLCSSVQDGTAEEGIQCTEQTDRPNAQSKEQAYENSALNVTHLGKGRHI